MTEVSISFPYVLNEQGRPMIWFGSWLVGEDGVEGEWFHSDRGSAEIRVAAPPSATGVRIRRWPNDGFDAEYADVFDLAGAGLIDAGVLDYDRRQRFSLLSEQFSDENPWGRARGIPAPV
ncbi:MAG: hypothetical protein R3B97_12615 [Dehalococcoidia bacterium]|nr:hypothetical protein [Dehalococcoidia bacterium]